MGVLNSTGDEGPAPPGFGDQATAGAWEVQARDGLQLVRFLERVLKGEPGLGVPAKDESMSEDDFREANRLEARAEYLVILLGRYHEKLKRISQGLR